MLLDGRLSVIFFFFILCGVLACILHLLVDLEVMLLWCGIESIMYWELVYHRSHELPPHLYLRYLICACFESQVGVFMDMK